MRIFMNNIIFKVCFIFPPQSLNPREKFYLLTLPPSTRRHTRYYCTHPNGSITLALLSARGMRYVSQTKYHLHVSYISCPIVLIPVLVTPVKKCLISPTHHPLSKSTQVLRDFLFPLIFFGSLGYSH